MLVCETHTERDTVSDTETENIEQKISEGIDVCVGIKF